MSIKNFPAPTLRKAGLNFVVLPGQIIQLLKNPLSLAIWCYLQSHAEGWVIRRAEIMNHFAIGRYKYDAAMMELREAGLVWSESSRDPETQKMIGRRLVCSNLPADVAGQYLSSPDGRRSENQTFDKSCEKTEGRISRLSGQSTGRASRPVGPSDHLMNYQDIINNQGEREINKITIQPDTMPSEALLDSVVESTITPPEFAFGQWPAFLGHNLGKQFADDELQGAFIKWVGRAWNDFGGESAHFSKTVARMNRMPPRNAKKAP